MKTTGLFVGFLALFSLLTAAIPATAADEEYTLMFIPTQNAPLSATGAATATATMEIKVNPTKPETDVLFKLRGAYPNTLYTIWVVFNPLTWTPDSPTNTSTHSISSSSCNARPGFPPEGNAVCPLARLEDAYTSGMGWDPGASFRTDNKGNKDINIKLDYDLIREPPVCNKNIVYQCAPGKLAADGTCPTASRVRITSTWLRKLIGEVKAEGYDPAVHCANYNPAYDPDVPGSVPPNGMNANLWQCVDPDSGRLSDGKAIPRVHRYNSWDHFRLANHPDNLTHGFLGGSGTDHWIDMVGSYSDLVQTKGGGVSSIVASRGDDD